MKVIKLTLGEFETNTYVITGDGGSIVVDPAGEPEKLAAVANEHGAPVKLILLTHGHLDHTIAAEELSRLTNADVIIHPLDAEKVQTAEKALPIPYDYAQFTPVKHLRFCKDNEIISCSGIELTVLHTPGHTAGSVSFLNMSEKILFSGDTLFRRSMGATADETSSMPQILQSLSRLANLDGDYLVLSGHGDDTTLAEERLYNQYIPE